MKSLFLVLPLLLSGCWLDHGKPAPTPPQDPPSGPPPAETLSGVAAIGAPVVGAIVEIRCDGFTDSAMTDDDGAWTAEIPAGVAPCLLKASGGEPPVTLYSHATAAGTVNITPLTTLIVARAVAASGGGTDLDAAFDAGELDPAALADAIADAADELLAALVDAGLGVEDGLDPFGAEFEPVAGDPYDDLLEALAAGLEDAGLDFEDFLADWAERGPDAIPSDGGTDPGAGDGDTGGDDDTGDDTGGDDTGGDDTGGDDDDDGGDNGGGDPAPSVLDGKTGASAMVGGNRMTALVTRDFDGWPYSTGNTRFDVSDESDTVKFQLAGYSAAEGHVGDPQACSDIGAPSLQVVLNTFTTYTATPGAGDGAGCTITVTERGDDYIAGRFSGTLYRFGVDEPLEVTDGEFRYKVVKFGDGEQVAASFEGLATGKLGGKGDGDGDTGWAGTWVHPNADMSVVDLATPMTYTYGGENLDGGAQAMALKSGGISNIDGRLFAKNFDGDLYFSVLLRATTDTNPNRTRINFGTLGFYVGVDDAADPDNHFVANLGPTVSRFGGRLEAGRTYLLVARLWQSTGDIYDRIDAWVDPQPDDFDTPHGTASGVPVSGSLRFVNRVRFTIDGQLDTLELDRFRFAGDWDSLFTATVELPDPLAKDGECGGGAGDTSELPSGPDLIGTCAGEYPVMSVLDGDHARGTVTIGADNAIDFDDGANYSAADADSAGVYDRINCCNRIDVNYANGDKMMLHRSANGVLRTIVYTRSGEAPVGVSLLPPLAEGAADGSAFVGNGIAGTVDGVLQVEVPGAGPFLTGSAAGFSLGGGGTWHIRNVPPVIGVHECGTSSFGVRIDFLNNVTPGGGVSGGGGDGGRCTISVDGVTLNQFGGATEVWGRFHAELLTNGFNDIGNPGAFVEDGYFRFEL